MYEGSTKEVRRKPAPPSEPHGSETANGGFRSGDAARNAALASPPPPQVEEHDLERGRPQSEQIGWYE